MEDPNICEVPRWIRLKNELANIQRHELEDFLAQHPGILLLDVRRKTEFKDFHIKNAILLDYFEEQFLERLEDMDKESEYLIYCRSGRRSVRTATLMKNAGFRNLYHLEAGILDGREIPQHLLAQPQE